MIKVGIIEDDPEIRKLLQKMIERQSGFQVVFESGTFAQAIMEFTKYRPDVVFVDIDLNGESGLECAKVMTELSPKLKVIFATAHSEYMANAFEIYAFDYLVKPFNIERISRTLDRISSLIQPVPFEQEEKIAKSEYQDKLLVKGKESMSFIHIPDIILIQRENNATVIYTDTDSYSTSVSLSDLERRLDPEQFMRSHKSYIIDTNLSRYMT